jgi:putative transposase
MIDRSHELSLKREAQLLKLSRCSIYYRPRPDSPANLAMMRRMDELHLEHPFADSRILRDPMKSEGIQVGREHVATMMKRMGIEAISDGRTRRSRRPSTDLSVSAARSERSTVQPGLGHGHDLRAYGARLCYLAAVLDWFARKVLA